MREPPVELVRALAVLAEPPAPGHAGVAAALGLPEPPDASGHADLFLFQLHPYASVHLGPEGMLGGEARSRIGGFWRAVGRTPPSEPDHLAALLGLWAALLHEAEELGEEAAATLVRRSAAALLHEHLLPWLPPFLDRVREMGSPHHRAWADLLLGILVDRAGRAGGSHGLARHLREAPGLPDPREGEPAAFVPALLAPARSGVVLTRHDLASMARPLGLGLRAGERRYALEHLLGLDPRGMLTSLASFAGKAARAHAGWPDALAGVRGFWTERARASERLLAALAEDEADAPDTPERGDPGEGAALAGGRSS